MLAQVKQKRPRRSFIDVGSPLRTVRGGKSLDLSLTAIRGLVIEEREMRRMCGLNTESKKAWTRLSRR